MKRASSPFPAEFSGMAYFPLPIPAETSYAECRRFSDSLPGNAVFMANPACPVMKEPIPIQQWLPAGPLRDMGEKYVSQLPDVAQNPIGPESLMHQSDHSWSEYLVAYSLLYPGVVVILALLGGAGAWGFLHFLPPPGIFPPYFLFQMRLHDVPVRAALPGVRHAQSVPPCPELDRIFQAAHRGSSLRMEKA